MWTLDHRYNVGNFGASDESLSNPAIDIDNEDTGGVAACACVIRSATTLALALGMAAADRPAAAQLPELYRVDQVDWLNHSVVCDQVRGAGLGHRAGHFAFI